MATKSLTLDGLTYFYGKIKSIFQKDVNIWRGTCETAAATAAKAVTCSGFTSDDLVKGTIIFVTFSATNSATVGNLTMSVNGTTAKPIKKQYNTSSASNLASAGEFRANSTYLFQYDGTNWVCMTLDYDNTYANYSFGNGYAVQNNSSASATITATFSNYALATNGIVAVKFNYDVPANATLNINSKGAKAIYYKEAAITAGVIKAGDIATFVYSTNYKLLSVDRWQENDFVVVDITTSSMNESGTSGTVSFGTKKYSELQADVNSGKSVILRLDSSYLIPYIGWEADPPMYQFSSFVNLVFFVGTIWISASQGDNDSITGLFTFSSLPLDSNVVHKGDVGSSAEEITADKVFSGNVELGSSLFIDGGASAVVMGNDESDDTLQDLLDGKQAALVSGTNIKTIDSISLLGSGNIEILPYAGNAMTGSVDAVVTPGFYKTYGTIGASGLLIVNSSIIGRATVITQTRIVNGTVQYRKGTLTNDTVSSWSAWGNILNADNINYSDSTYSNEHYVVLGDSLNDAITELDDAIFAKSNAIPIIDLT